MGCAAQHHSGLYLSGLALQATRKNPARVGVFGLRYRQEGTYRLTTPNSSHWRAPAIWDLVSRPGSEVIVFNVPGTYPPTQVNGVMVSGKPAPNDAGVTITHPSDLLEKLQELTGGYLQGPSADFDDASRSEELETWERVLVCQQEALKYLMDAEPWDLVFAVSMALTPSVTTSGNTWTHYIHSTIHMMLSASATQYAPSTSSRIAASAESSDDWSLTTF